MPITNPTETRTALQKLLDFIGPLKENAQTASEAQFFEDLELGVTGLISEIDSDAIQSYADAINALKARLNNSSERLKKVQKDAKKLADNLKIISQAIESVGKLAKDAAA